MRPACSLGRRTTRRRRPGKVAFLFPGPGQPARRACSRDLFVAFPRLQRHLDTRRALARRRCSRRPRGRPRRAEAQRRALTDTGSPSPRSASPASPSRDLLRQARRAPRHRSPATATASSSRSRVAGALPTRHLLALSAARGQAHPRRRRGRRATPARWPPCAADAATVTRRISPAGADVVVANHNAPGPGRDLRARRPRSRPRSTALRAAGVGRQAHPGRVRVPQPARRRRRAPRSPRDLAERRRSRRPRSPSTPTPPARRTRPTPDGDRARCSPTRSASRSASSTQIEAMYAAGARVFVEAGPGRVLTELVGKILGDRPHVAVACDARRRARRCAAAAGARRARRARRAGRHRSRSSPAAMPRSSTSLRRRDPRPSASAGGSTDSAHGRCTASRPAHALRPVSAPLVARARRRRPHGGRLRTDREAVVLEYLRSMREMVEAQRARDAGLPRRARDRRARADRRRGDIRGARMRCRRRPLAAEVGATGRAARSASRAGPATLDIARGAARHRRAAHRLSAGDARPRSRPRGGPEHRLDQARRDPRRRGRAARCGRRRERARSFRRISSPIKTLRGIIDALRPLVEARRGRGGGRRRRRAARRPSTAPHAAAGAPATAHACADRAGAAGALCRGAAPDEARERRMVARESRRRHRRRRAIARGPCCSRTCTRPARRGIRRPTTRRNGRLDALVDLTPMRADWSADDVPALFTRLRHALVSGASHVLVGGMSYAPPDDGRRHRRTRRRRRGRDPRHDQEPAQGVARPAAAHGVLPAAV